jgi:hypothetical protein
MHASAAEQPFVVMQSVNELSSAVLMNIKVGIEFWGNI